ncbi:glycosyltransferase involved in cell wall biosynthesis [Rathayibacter sp. PhB151]|uniref:glycosyltransferase family 4 protein n=1 Tax=Rathayibacter sp. PhB151 TaxID=2485189 RepID=UPI001063A7BF|nr:glycosyltransferase family 4 protein [Rathayibacter sp. PhB151]TDX78345.1 glycosyltransferase involved in cell wall biosynthesis [Rathayibacter sp. PhB151]
MSGSVGRRRRPRPPAAASSPRTILFLHPSDETYGADRVLLEALRAVPEDVTAEVWLPDDLDYPARPLTRLLEERGVTVRRMPLPVLRRAYLRPCHLLSFLRQAAATSRAIRELGPALVYVNTAALALVLPVARLLGAPTLLHLHEHSRGIERWVLCLLFRSADRLVVVSRAVADTLTSSNRRRSTVVHNGFESTPPVPLPQGDELVFVLASRWNAWKGHEHFLRVWSRLQRRDVRLIVLGGPPVCGAGVDVPGIVAGMRNGESVEVRGECEDVRRVLDASHVVVVPSTSPDPLPTIALEAAAAGRAALVSRSGGLPEIVLDGVTGRTLTPGAVEEWVAVLEGLDLAAVESFGRAAHERSTAAFSRTEFVRRIGEELRAMLR